MFVLPGQESGGGDEDSDAEAIPEEDHDGAVAMVERVEGQAAAKFSIDNYGG